MNFPANYLNGSCMMMDVKRVFNVGASVDS
jgi:hypothetical protein